MRHVRAVSFFVTTLVLVAGTFTEAQQDRYGVVTSVLDPMHGAKANELLTGWVRLDFYWNQIEVGQNTYNWSDIDRFMNEAAARGLKVLASMSRTPSWAGPCHNCLPFNLADWQDFVSQAISRYSWSYNIVFGVWNEPNLDGFLQDDNSGTYYAQLFDYANRARNSVNPNAKLAGPETSWHAVPDMYFASWTAAFR